MSVSVGVVIGFVAWFIVRYLIAGLYTVDQNERAVKTILGRAQRLGDETTLDDPIAQALRPDERERYRYPQLRVIQPGGPYFKWPWERVHKVSIATRTLNMAYDPETPSANSGGTVLEAVTKDQLNTGLTGQIRYQVSERNLYAYLFGVKNPIAHVMGYFSGSASRTSKRRLRTIHEIVSRPTRRWSAVSRSMTCARTCAISTSTWIGSATLPPPATA